MTDQRTALMWLDQQEISRDAECWVLTQDAVLPVIRLTIGGQGVEGDYYNLQALVGDVIYSTAPVWSEPAPRPLKFGPVHDTLMANYSGGGVLLLDGAHRHSYRGSYVVNPEAAVFFIFLPFEVQYLKSHSEKSDEIKKQARELTERIENPWQT